MLRSSGTATIAWGKSPNDEPSFLKTVFLARGKSPPRSPKNPRKLRQEQAGCAEDNPLLGDADPEEVPRMAEITAELVRAVWIGQVLPHGVERCPRDAADLERPSARPIGPSWSQTTLPP